MNSLKTELVLWRLTWKLSRRCISGPRRRAIRRELRANLHASAEAVGEEEALRRLGDLNMVAAEYAESEAGSGREISIGGALIWALGVLLLIVLLNGRQLTISSGFVEQFDFDTWSWTLGLPNGEFTLVRLFSDIESQLLFQVVIAQASYVVFPLVAFLLGLRPWRLLTGGQHTPGQRPPSSV